MWRLRSIRWYDLWCVCSIRKGRRDRVRWRSTMLEIQQNNYRDLNYKVSTNPPHWRAQQIVQRPPWVPPIPPRGQQSQLLRLSNRNLPESSPTTTIFKYHNFDFGIAASCWPPKNDNYKTVDILKISTDTSGVSRRNKYRLDLWTSNLVSFWGKGRSLFATWNAWCEGTTALIFFCLSAYARSTSHSKCLQADVERVHAARRDLENCENWHF